MYLLRQIAVRETKSRNCFDQPHKTQKNKTMALLRRLREHITTSFHSVPKVGESDSEKEKKLKRKQNKIYLERLLARDRLCALQNFMNIPTLTVMSRSIDGCRERR